MITALAPRLECEGLSKAFNGLKAVSDVTLCLSGPGVVGLIGPNGAGKTTLLDLLTGFTEADEGRWWIDGTDVSRSTTKQIVGHGVVRSFQYPRLVGGLSALENVLLAAPISRNKSFLGAFWAASITKTSEDRERDEAKRLLEWTGLASHATKPASALSYGQQKLLALCCCLATKAQIVLLDEPVAGIHPALVSEIIERIREMSRRGHLVLVIEHNLDAIRAVAEHLLVMDRGRLIAEGPVEDVLLRKEVLDAYLR